MRLLALSTHDVRCGIADYNSDLVRHLRQSHTCDIEALPADGMITASALAAIAAKAETYDGVIIQHEWTFFAPQGSFRPSARMSASLLRQLRARRVPTVAILHSAIPPLPRPIPRLLSFGARARHAKRVLIKTINGSDNLHVVVHGQPCLQQYRLDGVADHKMTAEVFPLRYEPHVSPPPPRKRAPKDPATLIIFGFLSAYKGYETALNALRLLPDNVRLIIAGGVHPRATHDPTLDTIAGFIHTGRWLRNPTMPSVGDQFDADEREAFSKRVRITGFIPADKLTSIIETADIVLAPYTVDGPAGSAATASAIALGKPTIVSGVSTFSDLIAADAVRAVPPAGPYALAHVISELLSDQNEMHRLSAAALAFAERHCVDAMAQRLVQRLADLARAVRPVVGSAGAGRTIADAAIHGGAVEPR